jgi:hypothetical protein
MRLGGPRDGDTIGYFTVRNEGDLMKLEPFVALEWHEPEAEDG